MKKILIVDVPEGSNIQSVIIDIPMGIAPIKDFTEIPLPTKNDKVLNGIVEKHQFEALDSGELFNAIDGSDVYVIIREYFKEILTIPQGEIGRRMEISSLPDSAISLWRYPAGARRWK